MRVLAVFLFAFVVFAVVSPVWATGPVLNHCMFQWFEAVVPQGDLAGFYIKVGGAPGGPYASVGTFVVPPSQAGGNVTFAPNQNYCVGLTEGQKYAVVTPVDLALNEGPVSNEVPFVLDVTAPPAASSLSVK